MKAASEIKIPPESIQSARRWESKKKYYEKWI